MFNKKVLLFSLVSILLLLVISDSSAAKKELKPQNKDVITLYSAVDLKSSYDVISKIHDFNKYNKDKPIFLLIDSPGGLVFEGSKIIDAMEASQRPIYTVDVGMAASMSAYIHSYGKKRFMLPRAVLMYHHASSGFSGDVEHIESQLTMIRLMMRSFDNNVVARSGMSLGELYFKESNEYWVLADEALEKHLVEQVINSNDFPAHGPPLPEKDDKKEDKK